METRICKMCGKELPATNEYFKEYHNCRYDKTYLLYNCIECLKAHRKQSQLRWRIKNPNYGKQYRMENKEKIQKLQKTYVTNNYKILMEKWKKYSFDHKDEKSAYKKKYYYNNRDILKKESNEYQKNARDNLTTFYINKRLRERGIDKSMITPELIELQALIIKTKRYGKQHNECKRCDEKTI